MGQGQEFVFDDEVSTGSYWEEEKEMEGEKLKEVEDVQKENEKEKVKKVVKF